MSKPPPPPAPNPGPLQRTSTQKEKKWLATPVAEKDMAGVLDPTFDRLNDGDNVMS